MLPCWHPSSALELLKSLKLEPERIKRQMWIQLKTQKTISKFDTNVWARLKIPIEQSNLLFSQRLKIPAKQEEPQHRSEQTHKARRGVPLARCQQQRRKKRPNCPYVGGKVCLLSNRNISKKFLILRFRRRPLSVSLF